ncbi:hypothetical protein DFH07DRAFT_824819 [Mycena maculata]|uniref:Uncharacterized protein n=1 Tax=Mycena maculata TaxID=230809 RepID=A0AAD7J1X9_9AGAR|nr:hypothetical protein DFH07DRAFT_824819 [Mycena maculata]
MSALNITVFDQSPAFLYSPDREGDSSSSWESAWTGSPDSSYDTTHTAPNYGLGTSFHFTTLAGSSVELDFVGTAVTLYGQGTAGAYTTTLDGGEAISGAPSGSILATYGGLNDTNKHTIVLQVTQSQTLTLSYATVTIRSDIPASSVVNTTETAVTVGTNNTDSTNSFFSTSGSGFSNQHVDEGYTRLDTDSSGATTSFTCSNTSALFVYGTTNWNHQTFSFEIDPPTGASQGARIFNGTSKWFVLGNLVYFEAGMDPTQTYQVKMTNLIGGSYSDIHSVVMMNLPAEAGTSAAGSQTSSGASASTSSATSTSTPSKSSSAGKTVGITVGAVAAAATVIILALLCWRRRSRSTRKISRLSLDGMVVTPFGKSPTNGNTLPSLAETPMGLSHFRNQSEQYSTNYSIDSAMNSVQDLRDRAMGGPRYSSLSTSDDFNPYSDPRMQNSAGSGSMFAGSSNGQPTPTTHLGPQSYIRNSGKRPLPTEASSSSSQLPRQEVDAGRIVPDAVEETLPPNYDPTWAGN